MKTKPLFLLLAMLLLAARSHAEDLSLNFSGAGSEFVQVPNFDGLQVTNEVTVEFWAQPADAAQRMAFVLDADSGSNRFQAHLPWESGEFIWDFGNIDPPSQAGRLVVAAPSGSVGSWRHYALVATQSGNAMRIYQNGALVGSKTGMDALAATSAVLRIGGGATTPYSGKLDDFRIWNVARTEAEIRAGMASPPLGNEPGLRLYLRFDEASGTTAVNSATATGSAFNGTLNGAVARVASPFNSIVVQNTNDSGAGSLRQAIADAAAATTAPSLITFASGLNGGTITLLSEISVNTPQFLVVDASTLPGGLTLSGGNAKRLFSLSPGASATLRALTLTGGNGVGPTDSGRGGAIYNNSATLTLDRCTLHANTGNAALSDGGAVFNNFGSLTLTNCTLTANTAISRGGAIFSNGPLTLTHCTVVGNSISSGSGSSGGGGIYFENENVVGFTLENSIVAANTAPAQPDGKDILRLDGKLTRVGANLVQDYAEFPGTPTGTGPAFTNAAPNLAALASNGGPTQTMLPNAGSPAIDAAPGSAATTDQRGLVRPHDGDAVPGAVADIGAVEAGSVTLLVTNTHDSGPGSLRQALADAASLSGPNTLTFAPGLSGQTITFGGEIVVTDAGGVTVDASSLPAGLTLDGGPGTNRLFSVPTGTSLALTGLTLTGGNGGGATNNGNGGAILSRGTLTLTHCTLSGNTANDGSFGGGAIFSDTGTLTLTHCTFSGNSATSSRGGAICNGSGPLTLTHCTLSGNSAQRGGAILSGGGGTLTQTNSIIAGNTAPISGPDIAGALTLTGVNFIGDLSDTGLSASATLLTTAQNGPIQLGPLASNGGPAQTMALLPGSPAIDAVTAEAVIPGLTTDQRGLARSVDGDGNGTAPPDLGAFEHQRIVVTTLADENDTPASGGAGISLREALRDDASGTTPADTIGFAPALNGQTLTLNSEIVVTNPVAITTAGLAGGLTISGNNATRLFSVPGGTSLTLTGLTLTGGNGVGAIFSGDGGAILNQGTLTLTHCTLSGNSASEDGGAIRNIGTLTLTHCTLSGNSVGFYGGAIYNGLSCTLALTHCTLSGNSASEDGGAIFSTGTLTLTSSIIAGNMANFGGPDISRVAGTLTPTGVNFIGDLADSTLIASATLLTTAQNGPIQLAPLASNGGPTRTMALLPGSPAMDAASVISGLTTDQRGFARSRDGDGNGSAAPDIGAFEYQRVVVTTALDELNTPSDSGGTGLSLREALRDGADTVVFAPALVGATLTLNSEIVVTNPVAITAAGLAGGLTIDGGPGNNRIFSVPEGTSLTLTGLTLTGGNGAGATFSGTGGAILNQGTLTLTHCTLSGNSASGSSGAIDNGGTLTLTHCTLSGNSASFYGGAIDNLGTLTLTHCTLSGNSAGHGGAIASDHMLTLTNSIVAGNTASLSGPDISMFAGTITPNGVNFIGSLSGTGLTASATLLTTAQNGPIQLGPLASNGGPTQTMALLPGSPAINAAAALVPAITTDQRGQLQSGGAWDLGAYERQLSTSVTTTADSGEGSLRSALADAAVLPGADTLTFPVNFAAPITLSSELVITDTGGVTLDASALPALLTLDGGAGTNRILDVRPGASVTLRGLRFTGGNGGGAVLNTNGGAINNQGTLSVIKCAFESNSSAAGGAINSQGVLMVSQCSFVSNSASFGGAIHSGGSGLLTVADSTFLMNTAADRGGAVLENDADSPPGHPTLARCTFHGNTAFRGGAVGSFSLTNLIHCTLSDNTASGMGGGVLASATSVVTLTNCVVAGNQNAGSPDLGIEGTGVYTMAGVNLVSNFTGSGLSAGPALLTGDPLLAPINNYGGPTQTRALMPDSPARNAAAILSPAVTADQRGFPMVGTPDLGAYEAGTLSDFEAFAAETPGAALTPTGDADFDGRSDLLEYATQSDPNATSSSEITPTTYNQNAAGAVTQANVTFPTRVGATDLLYTLQRSTTLTGGWTTVATWNATTGVLTQASGVSASRHPGTGLVSVTDTNVSGEDNAFYRLDVQQVP